MHPYTLSTSILVFFDTSHACSVYLVPVGRSTSAVSTCVWPKFGRIYDVSTILREKRLFSCPPSPSPALGRPKIAFFAIQSTFFYHFLTSACDRGLIRTPLRFVPNTRHTPIKDATLSRYEIGHHYTMYHRSKKS